MIEKKLVLYLEMKMYERSKTLAKLWGPHLMSCQDPGDSDTKDPTFLV